VTILARQLTLDLYKCKSSALLDEAIIKREVENAIGSMGYRLVNSAVNKIEDGHTAFIFVCGEGHIVLHVYAELAYVAGDIFLMRENAEPERIFKDIRNIFKPEKTKTTFLKRGDFGREREVKPKIKTRVAPFRQIHNTGAKVIRILARRKR